MRLFRCVAGALLCCTAVALTPATTASAQATKTTGSTLQAAANYALDCGSQWGPWGSLSSADNDTPWAFVAYPTCTILGTAPKLDNNFFVPGPGTVTTARVKSGANPAPISIGTIRRYFKPNAQGQMEWTCCYGVSETATVNPTPNAITEIPVNLLVDARQPENGQTGLWDLVVVHIKGPGTFPMAEIGRHMSFAPADVPQGWWRFPHTAPGNNDVGNDFMSANFETLMQFDWTGCTKQFPGTTAARAAQACAEKTAPPTTPPPTAPTTPTAPVTTPKPKPLAAVQSSALKMKRGKVGVRVACTATTTCKGRVRIRTAAKKPRVLGSKALTIKAGKTATVSVGVAAKNRRYVKKKGTKVNVEVDLGMAGKITRALTLKR